MKVVFTIDEQYIQHICVAITSILDTNQNLNQFIVVSTEEISTSSKNKLTSIKSSNDFHIQFLTLQNKWVNDFVINIPYISKSTFIRLFLHEIIQDDVVLYLDSDILVLNKIDLTEEIVLNPNKLFAGVVDPYIPEEYSNKILKSTFHQYINAGVLLMNLAKMRKVNFSKKVIAYYTSSGHTIKYQDQDILNAVASGDIEYLSPKYNMMPAFSNENLPSPPFYNSTVVENAKANPSIIHFCGKDKPWFYMSTQPFKTSYLKYLKLTEFRNYKFPDKSIKNVLKKLYLKFISRFN